MSPFPLDKRWKLLKEKKKEHLYGMLTFLCDFHGFAMMASLKEITS